MLVSTQLLDPRLIYIEPPVLGYERGREILARFPHAERVEVKSHTKIPQLYGDSASAEDWLRLKRDVLVLGVKKGLQMRPNGRSADFIAPSSSNGCAMACSYCYVPRRKGYANPISVFVNVGQVAAAIRKHAEATGRKAMSNQVDPHAWVYDLGENGDLSVDALVSGNVRDLVAVFRDLPHSKGSFATKFVNRELLDYDPQGRTRVRFSLMPAEMAKVVDVRTSPVSERIRAINHFVAAGYEVHANFSPVVVHEGWQDEWRRLFREIDDVLTPKAKAQLKCEVTVKRFHYESHEQLRTHLADFMAAYNFGRRLKTLGGLTPYEYIARIWTSEPDRFIVNPIHQMPGLNN